MSRFVIHISLLLVIGLLAACGGGPRQIGAVEKDLARTQSSRTSADTATAEQSAEPISREDFEIDRRAYGWYVEGVLQEQEGHVDSAALYYRYAWRYFPESYEIGYSLATALFRLREPQLTLDVAHMISPQDADVWRLLAASYYELGHTDSVRIAYRKVAQLDPEDPRPFAFLAADYRRRNMMDSAAWALENVVRINEDDFRSWNEIGRIRLQTGEVEKAKDAFDQSLQLDESRSNVIALASFGEILSREGNVDSAETLYRKALELDPENLLVQSLLVTLYTENDRPAEALPFLKEMVAFEPDNDVTKRRLGLVYLELDSLEVADSVFSSLVEAGDRPWYNYFYLGQIRSEWEDYSKAAEYFSEAAKINDSSAMLWLNLGFTRRQLDQDAKEVQAYYDGLRSVTDLLGKRDLYFALGVAYEQADRVDSATWAFEEVLAIDPDNSQALNYLGYMLADRGLKLDYARDLIEKAVDLVPNNAAYLDSYGWVFFQMGKYKEAVEYLKQAVALDSDPTIFDHLGDAYDAIGQPDQARLWWQKALDLQPDNESIREKIDR